MVTFDRTVTESPSNETRETYQEELSQACFWLCCWECRMGDGEWGMGNGECTNIVVKVLVINMWYNSNFWRQSHLHI